MTASLGDVLPLRAGERPSRTGELAGSTQVVVAFAITTARGVVMFETGCGRPDFPTVSSEYGTDVLRYWEMETYPLEPELAKHGLSTSDVRAIVNSHLHWDHCGSNPLFPGVPIYVQQAEHDAARAGGRRYTVPDWVDFPGAEFVMIDGDARVADGIRVIATPGHSPGHQSLVLDTRDGPVVFAGQAVYDLAEWNELMTADEIDSSTRRLIEIGPRRVHFSHDHNIWEPSP